MIKATSLTVLLKQVKAVTVPIVTPTAEELLVIQNQSIALAGNFAPAKTKAALSWYKLNAQGMVTSNSACAPVYLTKIMVKGTIIIVKTTETTASIVK